MVLYAEHHAVQCAYFLANAAFVPDQDTAAFFIALVLGQGNDGECVMRETAAVLEDVAPDDSIDLLWFAERDAALAAITRVAAPFYQRDLGARLLTAPPTEM